MEVGYFVIQSSLATQQHWYSLMPRPVSGLGMRLTWCGACLEVVLIPRCTGLILSYLKPLFFLCRFSGSGEPCVPLIRQTGLGSSSLWLGHQRYHCRALLPLREWMGFRNFRSTEMIVLLIDSPVPILGKIMTCAAICSEVKWHRFEAWILLIHNLWLMFVAVLLLLPPTFCPSFSPSSSS